MKNVYCEIWGSSAFRHDKVIGALRVFKAINFEEVFFRKN